jgi:hypothetical protein
MLKLKIGLKVEVEDWTEGWTEGWTEDLRIPISRYVTDFPLCHRFPVSGGYRGPGYKERDLPPERERF